MRGASMSSDAIDPQPTKAPSKIPQRRMCYPFGPKHGRHRAVKRCDFIMLLSGAVAAWPLAARAQQAVPVLGFMSARSPEDSEHLVEAFRRGLREGGFVEGQNVAIEFRWARGQYELLPAMAA